MDKRKVPHLALIGWVGYFFCALFRLPCGLRLVISCHCFVCDLAEHVPFL